MHGPDAFLWNLALVLCVAAATTVLFQRLKQPVILGYLLAGFLVGPNRLFPLFADENMVRTLSELGVILLMYSLGLEFSIKKLLRIAKTGGLVAIIEVSVMVSLGYLIGQLLGFSPRASVFTGAIIAISSTTIIAKAFKEQKVDQRLGEIVFGVLVAEDLLAVLLVTVLTAVYAGSGLSADMVFVTVGKLVAFLIGVMVAGLLIIPRFVRFVVRLERNETTVVACVGISFAIAVLAYKMGYSVALGAFLAGTLVSESGEAKKIEHLIEPVRDVFAAIFFVSVGMSIDPRIMTSHWDAVLVLTGAVVLGKVISVSIGAFLSGASTREAIRSGMSLAQIGEFSFIIASLAAAADKKSSYLYPIAVAVSALTTLGTPWLIRGSGPIAQLIEENLPKPVQTFSSFYGAWISRLRESAPQPTFWSAFRRVVRLLLIDVAFVLAIIIGTSLTMAEIVAWLEKNLKMNPDLARLAVAAGAFALALPFLIGMARCAGSLGSMIAYEALPKKPAEQTGSESTMVVAAPPRALIISLQLAIVLVTGAPILALTGSFLPAWSGAAIFAAVLLAFTLMFLRSASHLEGQLRAGTEMVVDLLAKQTAQAQTKREPHALENAVQQAIPWFGSVHSVELARESEAVGKTLAEIGLRGRTGASVVAIQRGNNMLMPTADEALEAGDILALTGSDPAIKAARLVLAAPGGVSDGHTELIINR